MDLAGHHGDVPQTSNGRTRRYEQVVEQILDLVREEQLEPGQALPRERDLAAQFGVSRNVVRQAFGVLEERGIVLGRQGSGRYLRSIGNDRSDSGGALDSMEAASIADVHEARILLEREVVILACQRRTTQEADELLLLADRFTKWSETVAFHVAIASATHNFMLERLVQQQAELLGHLHQRNHYRDDPAHIAKTCKEHGDIAHAIAVRDEVLAAKLITEHIQGTRSLIMPESAHKPGVTLQINWPVTGSNPFVGSPQTPDRP